MNERNNTKLKCKTCGHIIAKPITNLSSIEYCRRINNIQNFRDFESLREYILHYVDTKYNDSLFLRNLNDKIEDEVSIDNLKLWLICYSGINYCEESQLYHYLASIHNIDETFIEFYNKFIQETSSTLNKNRVSRALSAIGIKTMMKRIDNKCCIVIRVSNVELTEILRKNGYDIKA
jgi:hypothetical protein